MPVDASVYSQFKPFDLGEAIEGGQRIKENRLRMSDLANQRAKEQRLEGMQTESHAATMRNQNLEFQNKQLEIVGPEMERLASMPEEQRAVEYPLSRQRLLKQGIIKADDSPEEYDPGYFRQSYSQYIKSPGYLDRQMKEAQTAKYYADAKSDPEMKKLTLEKLRAETSKLRAEASKAGKGPGYRELPADKVLLVNEGNNIPGQLGDIKNTIDSNLDMFGPVAGRLGSMNPYNEKAQTMDSQIRASSQAFGRYMEGGVLRKEDEDKYRKMFPNMSDTPEVAKNKLAIVDRLLSQKQNSNVGALRDQGFDVSGIDKGLAVPGVPTVLAGKPEKEGSGGGIIKDAKASKQWDSVETNPKYFEALKFIKANPNDPRAKQMLEKLKGGT